jgi:hypothetical protein
MQKGALTDASSWNSAFRIQVVYETPADVPVAQIADSLLGIEAILSEIGPFIEYIVPGLVVDAIHVSLKEVSQGNCSAFIFLGRYDTLITVLFCLLMYYGQIVCISKQPLIRAARVLPMSWRRLQQLVLPDAGG